MKYYLLLLCMISSSSNAYFEQPKPCVYADARKIFFGKHSYICFDEKFYIHDPDCYCASEWYSITRDNDGNVLNSTQYTRKMVFPAD